MPDKLSTPIGPPGGMVRVDNPFLYDPEDFLDPDEHPEVQANIEKRLREVLLKNSEK